MKKVRSPLFYVGDKYKLMPQLTELFPIYINNFYDVFAGGGSASIHTSAKHHHLNDIDINIIKLHEFLAHELKTPENFFNKIEDLITYYGLSRSEFGISEQIKQIKEQHKKTYFSIYNKSSYIELRRDYNMDKNNMYLLYLLLVFGFNHMIRFNSNGDFNLPVGNVDWNKNVTNALNNYKNWVNSTTVTYYSMDFEEFVNQQSIKTGDFFYFDPPYLITHSDYNKLWNEEDEKRLYNLLDEMNDRGIKWGLSNMYQHKERTNEIFYKWAKKYNEFSVKSNYISRFDNSIKKDSKEMYVTNYDATLFEFFNLEE